MGHVVVIGGGNAALCAGLAAREQGGEVTVLERAPRAERGGNSAFTAGIVRFAFNDVDDLRVFVPDMTDTETTEHGYGCYTEQQFLADMARLTEYRTPGSRRARPTARVSKIRVVAVGCSRPGSSAVLCSRDRAVPAGVVVARRVSTPRFSLGMARPRSRTKVLSLSSNAAISASSMCVAKLAPARACKQAANRRCRQVSARSPGRSRD